jgi:hypothetical protein
MRSAAAKKKGVRRSRNSARRPNKTWFYEVTGKPKHPQDFTNDTNPTDSRGRSIDEAYLLRTEPQTNRPLGPGRPSLNGKSEPSPRINLRVSPKLLKQAERVAKRKKVSVSELTRIALAKEVARLGR